MRSRFEPRRFVSADLSSWAGRLKTAVRLAALWSVLKLLAGMATGGWSLAADGLSSGAELLGLWLLSFQGSQNHSGDNRTGRLVLLGAVSMLLFMTGVIIIRIGLGLLLAPGPVFPVSFLITAVLSMAGQFITARYVSARQEMTAAHVPVYKMLAGNVLLSVFITIVAAATSFPLWKDADVFLVLGIGVITILKAVSTLHLMITTVLDAPQPEPGMMDVAAVLCSHPVIEETHSLRLVRSSNGNTVLKASVVMQRDQFPHALKVKTELEKKVKAEFGVSRLDLRYELKPGPEAQWKGRAVFDQFMLN